MEKEPTSLNRAELMEVVDSIESALNVLRRHSGTKTALDVYVSSVFTSVRRSLINRALIFEDDTTRAPFAHSADSERAL